VIGPASPGVLFYYRQTKCSASRSAPSAHPGGPDRLGLFGIVMPAVWHPIVTAHGNNWYAFIHVTTASTAWLSAALGIAFIA
jgi:hypothetical protein